MKKYILLLFSLFYFILSVFSQNIGDNCIITLDNGSKISGIIQREDTNSIYLIDNDGIERTIPKIKISEISKAEPDNTQINIQSNNQVSYINEKDNEFFSIGLGYGNSYGGFGATLQYKFGFAAIHCGIGYFPASVLIGFDFIDNVTLSELGLKLYVDKDQKLYLNAQYGSFGVKAIKIEYSGYPDEEYQSVMKGPSFLFGVDAYLNEHTGFNAGIGFSYNVVEDEWDDLFDRNTTYWFAIDLGFLIKF